MKASIASLQESLAKRDYKKSIFIFNVLRKQNYPQSILDHFVSIHPFLEIDNGDRTREYVAKNITNSDLGLVRDNPLVSIIIVAYNSREDLGDCLDSVLKQSYNNWELILVDNGDDDSAAFAKKKIATAKTIKCDNVGFAEGNNVGLRNSSGDLLLLLNPDARLGKEALKEMVFAARQDPQVVAVVPKIYFYEPFVRLRITSGDERISLDYLDIVDQLDYKKLFILEGALEDSHLIPNKAGEILVDIPIRQDANILNLTVNHRSSGEKSSKILVNFVGSSADAQYFLLESGLPRTNIRILIDKNIHSSARFLINNAGSGFRSNGIPYDIGFGEEDNGQYNTKRYVPALCGCCALLRRDIFIKRKIFAAEFFAYFEDTELSNWINENKFKILYKNTPVFHKHSTTTQEYSLVWKTLVERSRRLYDYIKNNHAQRGDQRENTNYYSLSYEGLPEQLKTKLVTLDKSIATNTVQDLVFEDFIAIGIYNSYWSSMGGGEKHALDFAVKYSKIPNAKVFLLSERDFCISELEEYFDLNLKECSKILIKEMTTSLTNRFDIFLNSTYRSNLISEALNSFYIVSFPHKKVDPKFIASYTFLHNSEFTTQWANNYWGHHEHRVILPIQQFSPSKKVNDTANKENICLTVGRFNYEGHCKNQHLVIQAFNKVMNQIDGEKKWKLMVIGSVDESDSSSVKHYCDCKSMENANIEVLANLDRKNLELIYKRASIYIHATGINANCNEEPQKCEHFGITVFEALVNGCYPIVHNSGGPVEQVEGLKYSSLYTTQEELAEQIVNAISTIEDIRNDNNDLHKEITTHAEAILSSNQDIITETIKA